jgi:hypothetical protein
VVVENRPVREVAYGVSKSWLHELLARYRREGDAVFQPRSRRPQTSPTAVPAEAVDLIVELRQKLSAAGLDAGPDTLVWHLEHHHQTAVSRATVARYLAKHGLVVPEPKKRPLVWMGTWPGQVRGVLKDTDGADQKVTLQAWLPERAHLVATSRERDLDHALAEVRRDLIRQIEHERLRREPRERRKTRKRTT